MKSRYLKFSSKAEAESVLFKTVNGDVVPKYRFTADVIGQIYKPTGKSITNPDGITQEVALVPGWHVNVIGEDADKFPTFEVKVNSPARNWA